MASITTWTRLETRQRTADLEVSLAARVHDPLWTLARQWQLGELRGNDAGTPVGVRVQASSGRLQRFVVGTVDDDSQERSRPYEDASMPLEAVVEAEPLNAENAPRLAVEAGAHFVRMLRAADLAGHVATFATAFPVIIAPSVELDPAGARFHDLVSRRLPDGFAIRRTLAPAIEAGTWPLALDVGSDVQKVVEVARRWLDWFATVVDTPAGQDTWVGERMEHSFAVSTVVGDGERVLASEEYASGRLEWHDFDLRGAASLGATAPAETVVRSVLPAPVTFPGMPAPRFWAFEDARIDLGAVTAGPDDIARMLLVGFAVDYGNDWFVVPVELPVGTLTTIDTLEVTDTFGVTATIRPASEVDGEGARWRMFGLSGDDGGTADLLFLPPVLSGSLEGQARERVAFARDELANLVWAIEEIVESSTGTPRRRDEEPRPPRRAGATPAGVLRYQVATGTAPHWHPLVAVADESGAATLEQREIHPAVGTVLGTSEPLRLREEELPGEGFGIERTFQLARWSGGRTIVWSARRRTGGSGPVSSGLHFDDVR